MMQLKDPEVTYAQSLQACKDGIIEDQSLKDKLNFSDSQLHEAANIYREYGMGGNLFRIQKSHTDGNAIIIGNLAKNDLVKLYEYYFVDKSKPARRYYDYLLASANGKCPFCGGIGDPSNLDHYLPKKYFSQFSVLPRNLVPACRDCNLGDKLANCAETEERQPIHPFLDKRHFFEQQWIFADYVTTQPSYIKFYVNPPTTWNACDQERVKNHFKNFGIEKKYMRRAAQAIVEVEAQMNSFLLRDDMEDFKKVVLNPVIQSAPFPNYWKRVMYVALLNAL